MLSQLFGDGREGLEELHRSVSDGGTAERRHLLGWARSCCAWAYLPKPRLLSPCSSYLLRSEARGRVTAIAVTVTAPN